MNNRSKNLKIIIIIIGLIVGIASAYAEEKPDSIKNNPVQITFVHPLGTNGREAGHLVNNFSLNLIYGISGGVRGAEIGGLVNLTQGNIRGFQAAGLGNHATGNLKGFQSAGLYNLVSGRSRGVQVGGLANINGDEFKGVCIGGLANIVERHSVGIQFSGLTNINGSHMQGFQATGITTINQGDIRGAQIAGLVNINMGHARGIQTAGLCNVNLEDLNGAQLAGLANVNIQDVEGVQIAGLTNVVKHKSQGFQLAGLVNISPYEHRGSQFAGLLNYARTLNGFQLGFINISDTVKRGVPLGFISLVTHGYRRFEIEGNEAFFFNLNFKTGTEKLYNIFSLGYRFKGEKQYWGVTYGIGTLASLSDRFRFNLDLTATHINEDEVWTSKLNLLNRLKFNISYRITEKLEIMGGPSFNVAVSKLRNSEGEITGSDLIPSATLYDETIQGTNVKMYIGFNTGIRF